MDAEYLAAAAEKCLLAEQGCACARHAVITNCAHAGAAGTKVHCKHTRNVSLCVSVCAYRSSGLPTEPTYYLRTCLEVCTYLWTTLPTYLPTWLPTTFVLVGLQPNAFVCLVAPCCILCHLPTYPPCAYVSAYDHAHRATMPDILGLALKILAKTRLVCRSTPTHASAIPCRCCSAPALPVARTLRPPCTGEWPVCCSTHQYDMYGV